MTAPVLSLVVATLGRRDELARLLASLAAQTEAGFEVLVVDQNDPGFLDGLLAGYATRLELVHLRSGRGLSRARNVGIRAARGALLAFPDDDCWYDPGVVAEVITRFAAAPDVGGLTGVTRDGQGNLSIGRFDEHGGAVTRDTVWRRGNSNSIFVRRSIADLVGGFDETLGVGASTPWQSSEESDFLLRALASGARLRFDPDLVVRHPQAAVDGAAARRRAVPYGRGFMRVLLLHRYGLATRAHAVLKPLAGSLVYAATGRVGRARLSFWSAWGRLDEAARAFLRPEDRP